MPDRDWSDRFRPSVAETTVSIELEVVRGIGGTLRANIWASHNRTRVLAFQSRLSSGPIPAEMADELRTVLASVVDHTLDRFFGVGPSSGGWTSFDNLAREHISDHLRRARHRDVLGESD